MLVVEELGMVEIGTLDVVCGALGDGKQFLNRSFAGTAVLETFVSFAQRFDDSMG